MNKNKTIKSIYLLLTEECNMRCTYCFEKNRQKGKVTKELCDRLVEYVTVCKTDDFSICLFGGEPTICEDELVYLVTELSKKMNTFEQVKKLNFSLITNALYYPSVFMDSICEIIKDNRNINITFQFSTTFQEETHNKTRLGIGGVDTYEQVTKTIKLYENKIIEFEKESGILLYSNIHPVVVEEDVKHLFEMYKNVIEKSISTMWFVPITENGEWKESSLSELEKQLDLIMAYNMEKNKNGDNEIFNRFSNLEKTGVTKEIPCGVGVGMMAIFPNGDISQCHRMKYAKDNSLISIDLKEQISVSNVNFISNSFDEIEYALVKSQFNYLDKDSKSLLENSDGLKCKDCPAFAECYICPAFNIENTQNPLVIDKKQCSVNIKLSRVLSHWATLVSRLVNRESHSCDCKNIDDNLSYTINQHSVIIPKLVDSLDDTQKTVNTLIDEHNTVVEYLDYLKKELEELKNKS